MYSKIIYFSGWEKVAGLVGANRTTFTIFGLKSGTQIRFRVFVQNENGFSAPTAQFEFQTIMGKTNSSQISSKNHFPKISVPPGPPGCPIPVFINDGKDLDVTWSEPDMDKYAPSTEYRVEAKGGTGEWREVGSISADYEMRMEIPDAKRSEIQNVRVIAMNKVGESEPSPVGEIK